MKSIINSKSKYTIITLIIISLFAILWIQIPNLVDEYRVDEDMRYFYQLNKFQDQDLYPNHYMRSILTIKTINIFDKSVDIFLNCPGYGLLFFLGSFLFSPTTFIKIIPIFVLPITVFIIFQFGRSIRNVKTGLTLAMLFIIFNLASPSSLSIGTGLPRAFVLPVLMAQLYFLYKRRYFLALGTTLFGTSIYPPLFLINLVVWGLHSLKINTKPTIKIVVSIQSILPLVITMLIGLLILSPMIFGRFENISKFEALGLGKSPTNGTHQDNNDTLTDDIDNFIPGGRYQLFTLFPLIGNGGLVDNDIDALHFFILFIICGLILTIRKQDALNIPIDIWWVFFGSMALFFVSWLSAGLTNSFLLYLPSRYSRVGIFIFLFFVVGLNINEFVRETIELIRKRTKNFVYGLIAMEFLLIIFFLVYPKDRFIMMGFNVEWLIIGLIFLLGVVSIAYNFKRKSSKKVLSEHKLNPINIFLIIGGLVFVIIVWAFYAGFVNRSYILNPKSSERALLEFIKTLPKNTLLAGTPCALDNVPLFAKRQILFSCELDSDDEKLTTNAINAYYADNFRTVADFCRTYNVDYLIIDPWTYTKDYLERGWIYYEPYNHRLLPKIIQRDEFVIMQIPDREKVFENEEYFVVSCDSFTSLVTVRDSSDINLH